MRMSKRLDHSEHLFKRFGLLNLYDLRELEMCKFIFNDIHNHKFFNFNQRLNVHGHNTRFNEQIDLPRPRVNVFSRSLFFEGIRSFNNLPSDLKECATLLKFKSCLKGYYLSRYSENA